MLTQVSRGLVKMNCKSNMNMKNNQVLVFVNILLFAHASPN